MNAPLPQPPEPAETPRWVCGRGLGPRLKWMVGTDGSLTSMSYARESGDLFFTDASGTITRVNRSGQITALNRLQENVVSLDWSDQGQFGAAIAGENLYIRFNADLSVVHEVELPDVGLAVAVSPFGHHAAVSLSNGRVYFFNERKRRIAQFETIRPLAFLDLCPSEPIVFGAAEHGLVCCYNLTGAEIWQEKNWSNVGGMAMTGDGDLIYLAGFGHGVEAYDGDGASLGSYVLDGTVHRVAVSFEPQRLIAATIERSLIWLDADGELLWSTTVDDDVSQLICDPFGEWAIVGLENKGIYRIDWGGV